MIYIAGLSAIRFSALPLTGRQLAGILNRNEL